MVILLLIVSCKNIHETICTLKITNIEKAVDIMDEMDTVGKQCINQVRVQGIQTEREDKHDQRSGLGTGGTMDGENCFYVT